MSHEFSFEVVPLSDEVVNLKAEAEENGPVVLVVDDEPLIADTLGMILTRAGLTVIKAYDGRSALDLAVANRPKLLVTDFAMPGMNGVELAMAVVCAVPRCRVLMFSGHAATLDLGRARDAGFEFPVVSKPVHPADMVNYVLDGLRDKPLQAKTARVRPDELSFLTLTPQFGG